MTSGLDGARAIPAASPRSPETTTRPAGAETRPDGIIPNPTERIQVYDGF